MPSAIQRRAQLAIEAERKDRAEAKTRAAENIKEAARIYLPQLEAAWQDAEPEERRLTRTGISTEAVEFGPRLWAIFAVEQRLREVGIIGNVNRRTGETLDTWVVDRGRQSVYCVREIDTDERERMTLLISYLIGSLVADHFQTFRHLKVEVGVGEIRLVEKEAGL